MTAAQKPVSVRNTLVFIRSIRALEGYRLLRTVIRLSERKWWPLLNLPCCGVGREFVHYFIEKGCTNFDYSFFSSIYAYKGYSIGPTWNYHKTFVN